MSPCTLRVHVVVSDLREELVVYINGTPYTRRELEMPAAALHHAGVQTKQAGWPSGPTMGVSMSWEPFLSLLFGGGLQLLYVGEACGWQWWAVLLQEVAVVGCPRAGGGSGGLSSCRMWQWWAVLM